MATHRGNDGAVKQGASWAAGTAVGELKAWTMQLAAETMDDSALTDAWDTHLVGGKSGRGTITVHLDPADTSQAAMTVGASVTLFLSGMEGDSGDKYFTCAATITGIGVTVARNQVVERTFDWTANGAVTESTI